MTSQKSPIERSLLSLAWPIFVEQALHVATGTVDTFMVSHISDGAVAALGTAHQIVILCLIIFSFVGIGTSVVVTHHLGAQDREGADRIAATAIGVNTWLGLAVSLTVWFFAEPMLRAMQLSDALLVYALPFLHLMGGTLFLESINFSLSAILRAHGHTRDAMWTTLGQNVLNFIGNAILLFGLFGAPKMGIVGVALSTVFSRFVACIVLWIMLKRRTHMRIRVRDFCYLKRDRLDRILHIGLPAAGENISWWLAYMTITALTARMGDTQLATLSYTMQISWCASLISLSIALATEIKIGHYVGAGRFEDVYGQTIRSLKIGWTVSTVGIALIVLGSPYIYGAFTDDAQILATGAILMRFCLLIEPGRVANLVIINALRATGDARFPVMVGVASQWSVMAFGGWLLGTHFGLGLPGIWAAMVLDEWLRSFLMIRRWRRRRWIKYAERTYAAAQAKS